jgi:hypothetical protein
MWIYKLEYPKIDATVAAPGPDYPSELENDFGEGLEPVPLWANFHWLPKADYLPCSWGTIISKRCLDVLKSVGSFQHKTRPVTLYEHGQWKGRVREPPWGPGGGPVFRSSSAKTRTCDDYVAVWLAELDFVDWSGTPYATWSEDRKTAKLLNVHRATIIEPSKGFPPFFSIAHFLWGGRLVSESARRTLERAGCKVSFGSMSGYVKIVGGRSAQLKAARGKRARAAKSST